MKDKKKILIVVSLLVILVGSISMSQILGMSDQNSVLIENTTPENLSAIDNSVLIDYSDTASHVDTVLPDLNPIGGTIEIRPIIDEPDYTRSLSMSCSATPVWRQSGPINVRYSFTLTGYTRASLTLRVIIYDNDSGTEVIETTSTTGRTIYGSCTITHSFSAPFSNLGTKRVYAQAYGYAYYSITGGGGGGAVIDGSPNRNVIDYASEARVSVSKASNLGYNFFQGKALYSSSAPPTDYMTTESGNAKYYDEGLENDGFGIPSANSLWHLNLAFWRDPLSPPSIDFDEHFDGISSSISGYDLAEMALNYANDIMSNVPVGDYTYPIKIPCICSDEFIRDSGWTGVCDEYSVVLIGVCRMLGLPARYIAGHGLDANGDPWGHAWTEIWDGSRWIHADATARLFDNPGHYKSSGVTDMTAPDLRVYCCGDDRDTVDEDTIDHIDPSPTDGVLSQNDWLYVKYVTSLSVYLCP